MYYYAHRYLTMSKQSSSRNSTSIVFAGYDDTVSPELQAKKATEPVGSGVAYYGLEQILPRGVELPKELSDSEDVLANAVE